MQNTIIKPKSIGNVSEKSDNGQLLLYVDVQLISGDWQTWVIPISCLLELKYINFIPETSE